MFSSKDSDLKLASIEQSLMHKDPTPIGDAGCPCEWPPTEATPRDITGKASHHRPPAAHENKLPSRDTDQGTKKQEWKGSVMISSSFD